MSSDRNMENLPIEWKEKFQMLLEVVQKQEDMISELKKRPTSECLSENAAMKYMQMYQSFLLKVQAENWFVERIYQTEHRAKSVEIEFDKYTEIIESKLDRNEKRDFRNFLKDLNLISKDTFNTKNGGIILGKGGNRKRVFRIPKEVYCRLTGDADEMVS